MAKENHKSYCLNNLRYITEMAKEKINKFKFPVKIVLYFCNTYQAVRLN